MNAWTGIAPVEGGPLGLPNKAAKLALLANKEDKILRVSSKVKNATKYGKGFDSGDARHVNSGYSRVTRLRMVLAKLQIQDPSYSGKWSNKWNALLRKIYSARENPNRVKDLAKYKKEEKLMLQDFIDNYGLH